MTMASLTQGSPIRSPRRMAAALACTRASGQALALTVHAVLLVLVLGQIVYLGSRHRVRIDATSDDQYSLTDSTKAILDGLDKRLVVEAYLSPKSDMPAQLRDSRTVLDNFLDELVQLGRGRVVVQRFDPLADKVVEDKCTRVGVKPMQARTSSTNALEVKRHYQGLRLVYGGGKQKVVEQIMPRSTFEAEAVVTPAIKEVVTETRRKIGFMEWPGEPPGGPQGGGQPLAWTQVRSFDLVAKRYEFQNVKDAEGTLVPDEITTLMLFRPKGLGDREKYVVDQFLMRGGTLVVFADVADYGIAPRRQFNKLPFLLDDKDSKVRWQDQLLSYGVDLTGKLVADPQPEAWRSALGSGHECLGLPTQMGFAQQIEGYPYFFHPVVYDWAQAADQLAGIGGRKDQELADYYRKTLRPGIDSEEFLFRAWKRIGRGPGFYWPCEVGLRRENGGTSLPPGVDGRVLLWSSPRSLVEDPPQSLDPLGQGDLRANYAAFIQKLARRQESEPVRQSGLMVEVHGTFPSFFADRARPKRPAEIKEEEARKAAAAAGNDADQEHAQDPAAAKTPEVGPPAPKPPEPAPVAVQSEPDPLTAAKAPGRLVVVGDSDFLRDDFVRGDYRQLGGPESIYGRNFFLLFVDWVSQDSDLIALQSRGPVDRRLKLDEADGGRVVDPRTAEQQLNDRVQTLVWLNVGGPCAVLLALGLATFFVRRQQKRQFLASIGN